MKDKLDNIFSDSECISEETMYAYMENKLTAQERRIVEVHLASCELCSDALEGLSLVRDKDKIRRIVADINEKILANNGVVKPKSFWMNYRFSIAAALAFLVISIGAYFMITNNSEKTDQKIFAEKFKPFPNEVTKQEKDEGNTGAASGGEDKGPQAPDAPVGKDVPVKGKVALAERNLQNIDKLEESEKSNMLEQLNKNVIGQGDPPPKQPIVVGKSDRWFNNDTKDGKYSRTDSSVLRSEITTTDVSGASVLSQGVAVTNTVMADSISVVAGDQIQISHEKSADILYKADLKNGEYVAGGTTKNDKQKDESKKKSTPAKVNTGIDADKGIAFSSPKGTTTDNKHENNRVQTTILPAPNMSQNGIINNDNNNITNGNVGATQGGKSNSGYYVVDNKAGLDTGMKKYEEKDYGGAISSYDGVLASDPNNYDALFYSGVSYLSLNKPDKAIVALDKVLKVKDGKYYEAAQWYKALALIKQNDDKGAKKILREIISNGGTYKNQANDTYNKLK